MIFGGHSLNKLKSTYEEISFLQNRYYKYGNIGICGTRGWLCPNEVKFDKDDEKIYKREQLRLKMSLDSAVKDGCDELIVITHYPPTNDKLENRNLQRFMKSTM